MTRLHRLLIAVLFLLTLSVIGCSEEQEPTPDVTPPVVSLAIEGLSPISESSEPPVVGSTITVKVAASDDDQIQMIEAFIDDEKVGEDRTAPYQLVIDLSQYQSKGLKLSKTQTVYTLTVSATDKAGNTASTSQKIIVDNEIPVISEVNLTPDSVLGGALNQVSFKATDNQGLASLEVSLNGAPLEVIQDSITYIFNIDTSLLTDGLQTILIKANDEAENSAEHTVPFISDNSGPELRFEGIEEGSILGQSITLSPSAQDALSLMDTLTLKINDSIVFHDMYREDLTLNIDPEELPVGVTVFKLLGSDALGNKDSISVTTEVKRFLFSVTMESGFLRPSWKSFWILLNDPNGALLLQRPVSNGETSVDVHAPGEWELSKKYTVTFLAESLSDHADVTSVYQVDRRNFTEIQFSASNWNAPRTVTEFTTEGFTTSSQGPEFLSANGKGYYAGHYYYETPPYISLVNFTEENTHDTHYFYSTNLEGIPYAYKMLEKEAISASLILSKSQLETAMAKPEYLSITSPHTGYPILELNGFLNETDVQNNQYHTVYSESPEKVFGDQYEYYTNELFSHFSHSMRVNNYLTQRMSAPLDLYSIPDWTVNLTQNGNQILPALTGTEHRVGKVHLLPETGNSYRMTLIFPSQEASAIHLPELPDALNSLSFYQELSSGSLSVKLMTVSSYDQIPTYDDYIQKVIRLGKNDPYASSIIETKSQETSSVFYFANFLFD